MKRPQCQDLHDLHHHVMACRACSRLVAWREQVAAEKVKRFAHDTYWGKPVPGFGDPHARLLMVGLAPAAHGGNRTGRVFTGDRSGDWLYRALYKAGFANQPESTHRDDGLTLQDAYITAVVHCAPPANKPTPEEIRTCRPFLQAELALLHEVRVIVALGKLAFDQVLTLIGPAADAPRPVFSHGVQSRLANGVCLIGSYHPSQQNTFTGKLTEPMFDAIFTQVRTILS